VQTPNMDAETLTGQEASGAQGAVFDCVEYFEVRKRVGVGPRGPSR
jgi:hypothetical protein